MAVRRHATMVWIALVLCALLHPLNVESKSHRALLQVARDCHCEVSANTCCFYEHANYNGCAYGPYSWSQTTNVGSHANDKFSSMKCGHNVYAIVQEHGTSNGEFKDGTGRRVSLIGEEPDFGKFDFHDRTTAVFIKRISGVAVINKVSGNQPTNRFAMATDGTWDRARIERELKFSNDIVDEVIVPDGRSIKLYLDDISPNQVTRYVGTGIADLAVVQRTLGAGRHNLRDIRVSYFDPPFGQRPANTSYRRVYGSWADAATAWQVNE